jgi:hypothetical protein
MSTSVEPAPSKRSVANAVRRINQMTVRDEPGQFEMLDKSQLEVDHAYQRKMLERKVVEMARDWSWVACGVIIVAIRQIGNGDNGRVIFMVVDGQHRVEAAKRRPDIEKLPCLVFEMDSKADEAKGFTDSNSMRRPLTMATKHNAMILYNDRKATITEALASSIGRNIADYTSPTTLSCVGEIHKFLDQDEAALRRIWPIVGKICEGKAFHRRILGGMFYVETHLTAGESLSHPRWRKIVEQRGYDTLLDGINKVVALRGNGHIPHCGEGILAVINRGLRQHLTME